MLKTAARIVGFGLMESFKMMGAGAGITCAHKIFGASSLLVAEEVGISSIEFLNYEVKDHISIHLG